jgi:hypothetical protein
LTLRRIEPARRGERPISYVSAVAAGLALVVVAPGSWLEPCLAACALVLMCWRHPIPAVRICLATGSIVAVFLFGAWLTAPAFPVNQRFVAVGLNGEPLPRLRWAKGLTFEARRGGMFRVSVGGRGLCGDGDWADTMTVVPPNIIIKWDIKWDDGPVFNTARVCLYDELESRLLTVLRAATRWRIENGALILGNGTDAIQFLLDPS